MEARSPTEPKVRSYRAILTDAGRGLSSHPLEYGDCAVRAVALTTGLSYDEAWDELAGAGRPPLDGFMWEDWTRKAGFILAPWTGKPHWLYRYVSLEARKGFPRIRPRDLPSLFPKGRWVMTSTGHVESWIEGRHYDSATALPLLAPNRIIYGAWECRRIAADQKLFHAYRCYFYEGNAYKSAIGPVAATSLHGAYEVASLWYENKIRPKKSDLVVERA